MSRYINPYTDFGFKKLFGEEANKDLLIDFLNAVLPLKNPIAELTFRNPEQLPDNIVDRKAVFDIDCVSKEGESFTVEMQKAKQHYFKDRALFYASYPIQRQAQKGDWNFRLNPVYFVAVLDFKYEEDEERQKLYRLVSLKDQDGDEFSETLKMVFLQMPLFGLSENELRNKKDKWLYFLKNLESFSDIPAILREPVFKKAFDEAEYLNLPLAAQEQYQRDLKTYRDNYAVLKTARDDGFDEGLAEGEAKGEARGKAEKKAEIARNMKKKGMKTELISELTGLSAAEVEKLDLFSN